jgi:N-acetylmuramoyl-L-alanine amidase
MKLVIDPGHGGSDPGAIGPAGTREKDITLAVSGRLGALLVGQGHEIVLTRDGDTFVSLAARADVANSRKADAFISIHCNAAVSRAAHGFEVWTSRGQTRADALSSRISTAWSLEFPFMTIRADWSDGDADKESGFAVLRKTSMPAALLELQFISHPEWEKWLNDKINQDRMAAAIAAGVGAWKAK